MTKEKVSRSKLWIWCQKNSSNKFKKRKRKHQQFYQGTPKMILYVTMFPVSWYPCSVCIPLCFVFLFPIIFIHGPCVCIFFLCFCISLLPVLSYVCSLCLCIHVSCFFLYPSVHCVCVSLFPGVVYTFSLCLLTSIPCVCVSIFHAHMWWLVRINIKANPVHLKMELPTGTELCNNFD